MYKIILNLPSTFLEKGIMYSTWLVVLVGMVCRRIGNKLSKMKRLAFITRYTPSAAKAMKIIRKYWPSLQQTNLFRNRSIPFPLLSYRSNRNTKSYLVRAKLPSLDQNITPLPSIEFPLNIEPSNNV